MSEGKFSRGGGNVWRGVVPGNVWKMSSGEGSSDHYVGPKFTDIVLRFILRCVIRSS